VLTTTPSNEYAWNTWFPEAKFSKLTELDRDIYGVCKSPDEALSKIAELQYSKPRKLRWISSPTVLTSIVIRCRSFVSSPRCLNIGLTEFDSRASVNLASSIVSLCEQSIRDIDAPDVGLAAQCVILSSAQSDPSSTSFRNAYTLATAMIGHLATAAQQTADGCMPLLNEMHFASYTETFMPHWDKRLSAAVRHDYSHRQRLYTVRPWTILRTCAQ
jgi:hypothetical protein